MAGNHLAAFVWAACALVACSNLSSLSGGTGDGGGAPDAGVIDALVPDADAGCTDPCVLATGLNHPVFVTNDGQSVYWTEYGDDLGVANGAVKSCPVSGCGAAGPVVLASGLINPIGVVVDAGTVYFTAASYGPSPGGVYSCPVTGCNGSPKKIAAAGVPQQVVLDPTYVYWIDFDDSTAHRAPRAGGGDQVLYDAGDGLVVQPEYCAVDGTSLYMGDANQDVFRIPIGGGPASQLVTSATDGVSPIVLDATNIYYAALGQVVRLGKPGTGAGVPIAKGLILTTSLVLDPSGPTLYWSDFGPSGQNNGSVGRVGTDGGAPTTLATELDPVNGVTLAGAYILWVTSGTTTNGNATQPSTGTLVRHAK